MSFNPALINVIKNIFKPVVDTIYPPVCFLCDSILPGKRKVVCLDCWTKLKPLSDRELRKIKKAIIKSNIDDIFILYDFTQDFQRTIHLLKYERCLTLGKYFANELISKYGESFFENYDFILPTPLHPVKFRERGYNQCFEVIKYLPGNKNKNILSRKKETQSQTKLSRTERIQNVSGAFTCREKLNHKKVLLFDDIITTGSTLNECAGVLKNSGALVDTISLAAPLKHALN